MVSSEDFSAGGESAVIAAMVATILERQEKNYTPGTVARRGLHSKSLGVVKASLQVRKLPKEMQIGLFADPFTYDAVLRFSNGGLGPTAPDALPNIRGVGLKVFAVQGDKLLPGEENSTEQDFIMANYPTFFAATAEQMLMLMQGKIFKLLSERPAILLDAVKATAKIIESVLDIDYFSQVPYRFGRRSCKYALIHQAGTAARPNINLLDNDYLRNALEDQLMKGTAKFTLCVQIQQGNESDEDPTEQWSGPQIELADLTVLQIDNPLEESDGEDLTFNPYRSLAEHEPIGWAGRMRRAVYAADVEWRQKKNRQP
ncbi:catalase family protein [soil metagenome]